MDVMRIVMKNYPVMHHNYNLSKIEFQITLFKEEDMIEKVIYNEGSGRGCKQCTM
jgi:hypothetical protein